eukprot:10012081-Ditylum_brightwellii.AAC.1
MAMESLAIVGQRRGDNWFKVIEYACQLNTQMATQLYSPCVLQCSPFHATDDVLFNVNVMQPLNPFQWSLDMTSSINGTTKAVLMSAARAEELPAYAFNLATLPENQNRLGIYNPANSAVVSFLIPFIRCLCSTLQGIILRHKTVHMSPYLSNLFAD